MRRDSPPALRTDCGLIPASSRLSLCTPSTPHISLGSPPGSPSLSTPLFWRWMAADPGKRCPPDPSIQPKCRSSLLQLRKSPNSLAAQVCLPAAGGSGSATGSTMSGAVPAPRPQPHCLPRCACVLSRKMVSGSLCPLNTTEDPKEPLLVHAVSTNI